MSPIRKLVIAGGGTAGWMSAAALARFVPPTTELVLVESESIGTIGVGEATIPPLADFNHMLGIDEHTFLKETGGTYKLGIDFVDWGDVGSRYFHPFSQFGFDVNGLGFHQVWQWLENDQTRWPLDTFAIGAQASARARFIRPRLDDPQSPLAQMRHAYHIDAGRYAAFLRLYAEQRGVTRIEGRIESVQRDPHDGTIESLLLDDGQRLSADFFVDCTGFRALLVGDSLGSQWIDWSHWLPCDRAIAVPSEAHTRMETCTRSTAHRAGWQWRIPLQHRTGNGHVYCSEFMDDNEAETLLLAHIDTQVTDSPRPLRFRTGRRDQLWVKNCVAIGLSSGFVEPLESTSIHLIQEGISKLLALFPNAEDNNVLRDEYNELMVRLYDDVRDFIVLHYVANQRSESPFWQAVANMAIPDSLASRIDRFRQRGQWFAHRADLFAETSWVAVMIGQGIRPDTTHPLVESLDPAALQHQLTEMAAVYQAASEKMPPHVAYINRFCRTEDSAYQYAAA
ncbi:MAG: tryptophan halogenase family protein [Pseudomonadota bacterium]